MQSELRSCFWWRFQSVHECQNLLVPQPEGLNRKQAHNRLVADLDQQRFEVEETQSFTNEVATAISKLKEKDIRIVLGNFNETWARHIFCEAHRWVFGV
ncbi:hypothetical protein GE061_004690 [Apolygus lucorum]|uniref:Receptor ligand binding region domain-containing protein n=1 Tax=Apolygus lucorum TaxID=248454 RepID=A0A8S9WZW9_APOLU|nr:hypothetical protein GE061_004690 [Apolygus lucorum]